MEIAEFVTQLCEHCGIATDAIEVELDEDEETIYVQLNAPEEESGLLIGRHGETLNSVQRLLRLVFQRSSEDKRVVLNINQYREKRREKLKEMAENAARRVQESGRPFAFDTYFDAHERYIIHTTLSERGEYEDLESFSVGSGRNRRLHVQLKSSDEETVEDRETQELE